MRTMGKKKLKYGRSVEINVDRLKAAMNNCGMTVNALTDGADVSSATVNNMLAGKPVYRTTPASVAGALGISLALLISESSSRQGTSTIHEYLVSDVLTDWITASNGLKFQLCRLRHMELDRQARGKRFDLRDMATDEEQRCRTWIKRHPQVCESLRNHPNIIRNIKAFHDPVESHYWVIDEWIEGESLQRKLRGGAFDLITGRQMMLDVARGLSALHQEGIIRRELTPASILIRNADGRAILTEFELAKLIDRGPTVSTDDWPVDPYRAGEADSDDVDMRADIYSWSRISLHTLIVELPVVGDEVKGVHDLAMPNDIKQLLVDAASPFRSSRPESMEAVISVVENWR